MASWIVPPVAGLVEPVPAPEFFVTRIGAIERMSEDYVRLYGCSEQMPLEGGSALHIVQIKIVRPISTVSEGIAHMLRCMGVTCHDCEACRSGWTPRVVK